MFIPTKFVYLVAGLCGLYLSAAPFFTSFRGPITWFRVVMWIGMVLLLVAAVLPSSRTTNITADFTALVGSTLTTALLVYGIARFVAFRLGYIHGKGQLGIYRPSPFDRVNQIVTMPILLVFLISSVASLLISALITLRLRNAGHLHR